MMRMYIILSVVGWLWCVAVAIILWSKLRRPRSLLRGFPVVVVEPKGEPGELKRDA